MTVKTGKKFTLIAAAGMAFAVSAPTQAADVPAAAPLASSQYAHVDVLDEMTVEHKRKRHPHYARDHAYGHRNHYDDRGYYGEPVYRDTRIWRGREIDRSNSRCR